MAELKLRFKGQAPGENVGVLSCTKDGVTVSDGAITSWVKPAPVSGLPRITFASPDDIFQTAGTASLDETGLTGITARQWRVVGGANAGTAATQALSAFTDDDWIECVVTCDQGTLTTPPVMVYADGTMPSHDADDAAVMALVPHDEVTHIAVADGDWSNTATWNTGTVPGEGAFALIPYQKSVTYDETRRIRLDRVRVDGTLTWALDQSTTMLVETMVGGRGSSILMGSPGNRLPSQYTAKIWISGEDYSSDSREPTDLKSGNFLDTRGWGRGILSLGTWRIWGAEMTTWGYCEQVSSGATEITMLEAPTGWNVGDVIGIGGTRLSGSVGSRYNEGNVSTARAISQFSEDEYVTITSITGTSITFTPALTYSHINHNTASDRTDLYPVVFKRSGKNISIESEVKDVNWRRGHTANMHHHCVMDFWDGEFIGLGRTTKGIYTAAGIIDDNDDFFRSNDTGICKAETLTNTSNLVSRYPVHAHHCGFGRGADTATVNNCYVEDAPGWAIVHHACEANTDNNVMHLFGGAGMVSESGNEIGSWVGNLAIGTTGGKNCSMGATPKNTGRGRVSQGDFGWEGFGFVFRGRVMRTNRNVAVSCGWGHVYHHRTTNNSANAIGLPVAPFREYLDFKELLLGTSNWVKPASPLPPSGNRLEAINSVDVPITHNADNEAIACVGGFFVTKGGPRQGHDWNIHIKDFRSWGYPGIGFDIEYVANYLLENLDCVSQEAGVGAGIISTTNTFQIGIVGARTEGNAQGIFLGGGDALIPQVSDNYNNTTDPRHYIIGHTSNNDTTAIAYISFGGAPLTKDETDIVLVDDDPQNDTYDRFAIPQDTFPDYIGEIDFGAAFNTFFANQPADGTKIDNLSMSSQYPTKPLQEDAFHIAGGDYFRIASTAGHPAYGEYRLNGGSDRAIPAYHIVSDRVFATPAVKCRYATAVYPGSLPNLGTFDYSATAVTLTDSKLEATVAVEGTVVVDVITDSTPSGGNGTFVLSDRMKVAPDHGVATLDTGTGEVTYTPDLGYSGTDFMYVFVESAAQFATVRIDFLIGSSGGGITTPAATTHFTVADGGSQTIDVTMLAPPDTDKRRIKLVQYSTDSGSTWRRLSPRWVQGTQTISVESDDTAIAAGSYNVSLRYKTDYDFQTSTASGNAAVTVA